MPSHIYQRGVKYYRTKRVQLLDIRYNQFTALVTGTDIYRVEVAIQEDKLIASCDCPYWAQCKHIVAAILSADDYYYRHHEQILREKLNPAWQTFLQKLPIHANSDLHHQAPMNRNKYRLIFGLTLFDNFWELKPYKQTIKKNGELGQCSTIKSAIDIENENLEKSHEDAMFAHYLLSLGKSEQYGYYYRDELELGFIYGTTGICPTFDFHPDAPLYFIRDKMAGKPLTILKTIGSIELCLNEKDDVYEIEPIVHLNGTSVRLSPDFCILTSDPIWVLHQDQIFRVDKPTDAGFLMPFIQDNIKVSIPREELVPFLQEVFTKFSSEIPFDLPPSFQIDTYREFEDRFIILDESIRGLTVNLQFAYGNSRIALNDPRSEIYRMDEDNLHIIHIHRNFDAETETSETLLETGLRHTRNGADFFCIESKALTWLSKNLPLLAEQGFIIEGLEELTKFRMRIGEPRISIEVTSKIDWFDINMVIDFDGLLVNVAKLKRAISRRAQFIQLPDGSYVHISDALKTKIRSLLDFADVKNNKVRLSQHHLTFIDLLLTEAENKKSDEHFQARLQKLKDFKGIQPIPAPTALQGELRPYQKEGFNWLCFLQEFQFGGCLADDMGLGKTVQALALLLHEKECGNTLPSLIVCPTSVVFNWEYEIVKFAPSLSVLTYTGADRKAVFDSIPSHDIILTSYGILQRDIWKLKDIQFHYVILDESQKIKNPVTQTSKAVRLLFSNHRLVMTGTPIENNTIELWSQFAFINPGLLGNLTAFKSNFTKPIEIRKDEDVACMLRKMVFPFILRRTKEQVAKELPPKTEQLHFCEMTPQQQKLYTEWRDYFRAMILKKIDDEGMNKSRFNVLQGLVKLRQIACHPYLVDPDFKDTSGKFKTLLELLNEILSENHKVLLFSQFVKMLKIIRRHFDEKGIQYEYLDGRTRNREQCVTNFQTNPDIRIFLISLKAGGTGLNLTAADYVIHFDPWWNPAVEMQATDRSHRIGQDKKVFVYKLITKNSVEEKILELQERKNALVSNIITTDTTFFKSLSRDDIKALFS